MIKIVKIYDKQVIGTHREYCGRPGKGEAGLLGNPFWMKDESQRNRCCEQFEMYFKESIVYEHSALKHRVNELVEIAKTQDIELACFCQSPHDVVKKRCHCETIKQYIEEQLKPTICYHNSEWVDASTLVMSEIEYIPNKEGERFYNQTDGKY